MSTSGKLAAKEMAMGRVIVTEFISLDGVIEDPGGSEKGRTAFPHGGWTSGFDRGAEADEFKMRELRAADAQLLGRVTYEGFAAAWPAMRTTTGEFGEKMNAMPKYVVSTTLRDADATWENTKVIRADGRGAVSRLKGEIRGDILIAGSAKLVQ